jgi:ribose/xylose/arabinose/galactoside ABC-type transport system permease subunit
MRMVNKTDVNRIKRFMLDISGVWAILALIIAFYIGNEAFLNAFNLRNLINNLAPLLIMACGATLVTLIGSLDLSMGSVASCANVILVMLFPVFGIGAYLAAMAFGLVAGFMLGLVHTKLKMPSFIVSLGFMNIWNSVALTITPSPIGINRQFDKYISWGRVFLGPVSLSTVMAISVVLIVLGFHQFTVPGRSLNIIGGNERAARLSGIHIDFYKIIAFAICGFTSSLCGILLAVKLRSGAPTVGSPFTLQAVAAVLLGGTSSTGGRGSLYRTISGVAIVIIVLNGMTIIGVDPFWTQIVFGSLIMIAMILAGYRGSKNAVVK